jgi:hypothetical protein
MANDGSWPGLAVLFILGTNLFECILSTRSRVTECSMTSHSRKSANRPFTTIAAVRPPRYSIVRGWVSGHWSRCWRRRQIATVSVIQAVGAGDAWSGLRCCEPRTEGRGLWCAQCWRKVCARWAESFTNGRFYSRSSPQDQDALILALWRLA